MSRRRSGLAQQRKAYGFFPGAGVINGLTADNNNYPIPISWDAVPGAISYVVTSTETPGFPVSITYPTPTSALVEYYNASDGISQIVTVTAITLCGTANASVQVNPCFLAGSLVHMADGTTKAIEDVLVNDLVIGAFGEINRVLALHRPILGTAKMCKINDEHSTTNHHPHVSLDRQFYCGNPDLVSNTTYGHKHNVIDEYGNIVERMLHGLNKERIKKLHEDVILKTIEGSRITRSLEVYSMPEDTQLYNLVVDGSHTYHVDGYAVTGWPSEHDFDYDNWCPKP